MPHHAVLKTDSLTTKLRVIFDGSAASSTGVPLNQTLKKGPVIQDELFQILLRFRLHNVVLTADIAKMYRQVQVDSQDANHQLIFWRQDPSHKLQTYKLNTVTYGTTTAPFLVTLETDFYVDDLLTGFDTEENALQVAKDLIAILKKRHFELRKWCSSSQAVVREITESTSKNKSLNRMVITDSESIKILGLRWNIKQDSFEYTKAEETLNYNNINKRTILSTIAKLYDPMGLLGPIVIIAKLIIQQIWQLKTSWDETVPTEISKKWITFMNDLHHIKQLHIPRKITDFNSYETIEIHGFCDASELAYGACIYIRTTNVNGTHSSHLLCSKSRVAPLKKVSLPRLELCGAVLLSQLVQKVKTSFKIKFNRTILWTDSTIALAWIQMCPSVCKTFVANRISIIQKSTPNVTWRHNPGKENPADLISRGKYPSDIIDNLEWWRGPSWLLQNEDAWPEIRFRDI
ncbi:Pao retrotransposon peptidase [Popillia japonica]|uniref:Pao retrotransposon peptidase n=1 Tax=Popillia japonica TaxID=7064 RepID=A0AAW1MKD5_POPJA